MVRPENNPTPAPASRWLVSTDWLADRLGDPTVAIVDASYFLPTQKRDAHAEYRAGHIPGAVFFDIEAVSDHSTDLPHMLPGPDQFGEAASSLGIGDGDTVVAYDSVGLFSVARVWWTFRLFGAKSVYILDGGLPKWKAEGRAARSRRQQAPCRKNSPPTMTAGAVATVDDVRAASADNSAQVVDARSAERFAGRAPEPRPGLRSGHIPGSFNVPYDRVLDNGRLASRDRVTAAFTSAGIDLDRPIITSCGSGVTAAILYVRARSDRQGAEAPLRRLLGRMGLAARFTDRARLRRGADFRLVDGAAHEQGGSEPAPVDPMTLDEPVCDLHDFHDVDLIGVWRFARIFPNEEPFAIGEPAARSMPAHQIIRPAARALFEKAAYLRAPV